MTPPKVYLDYPQVEPAAASDQRGWAPHRDAHAAPGLAGGRGCRLDDVPHSPAFVDVKRLGAFNGEYIRALVVEEFVELCAPYLTADDVPWPPEQFNPVVFSAMADLVQAWELAKLKELTAKLKEINDRCEIRLKNPP